MGKRKPVVEWYMAESDAEWTRLCAPLLLDSELTANRRRPLNRYFWIVVVLLLLLAGAGEWWRRSTETSLYVGEAELRTPTGWLRTEPDAALWGPEQSLETPFFVYHFRQNDAPAVIAVAPQVDALYTTLRQNMGLPHPPGTEKLVIKVSLTQTRSDILSWSRLPNSLTLPSPAVYRVPVTLTDADLLKQSIALPLLTYLSEQAREHHVIGAEWHPLMDGLRLWQIWNLDLPLAVWREDVVQWIYLDLPATRSGEAVVLPDRYTALCAVHKLWMQSPVQLNIPLVCSDLYEEDGFLSPWSAQAPLIHLAQLAVPTVEPVFDPPAASHPGQAVALATLIEYTVVTYGRERLPALVGGLGQYHSWDILLPAVYDISPAEFEVGWQTYLAAHYGVKDFH